MLIKPCPFCGSEANSYRYGERAVVHCSNEKCTVHPEIHCIGEDVAINEWNTRKGDTNA